MPLRLTAQIVALVVLVVVHPGIAPADAPASGGQHTLRVGAAQVDVTSTQFPVLINGNFYERAVTSVHDPVYARAIVVDDGRKRVAIVVVDSCMMPRELLDRVKERAARSAGIPPERMLISATHSHSAPSAMGALGTRVDPNYPAFLVPQLVRAIEQAVAKLEPAEMSAGKVADEAHTFCRRWIYRRDRVGVDPFGQKTVRANMHPGFQNPDAIGPSGPVDPYLSLVEFHSPDGRPIAVLANYSMHYFGAEPVSADYFGRFCERLSMLIGKGKSKPAPLVIMSQGTSGDLMWLDYSKPKQRIEIEGYTDAVVDVAHKLYQQLRVQADARRHADCAPKPNTSVAMAEAKLMLGRRVPNPERLAWARAEVAKLGGRLPQTYAEVYALEAIYLHDEPQRELKLQAVRLGDVCITAIPDEVFGITGIKLREQSPLETFNIELANGSEGYIPPPEQHPLGGYTTWPARTAGLEPTAESKIVETVLTLLERVSGKPRRKPLEALLPSTAVVLASKPIAYWRLGELNPPVAEDSSGHNHHARYEGLVAHGVKGVAATSYGLGSRTAHFAGGTLRAKLRLPKTYSLEFWLWNGLPSNVREVTAYLFAQPDAQGQNGDVLMIGGRGPQQGKLVFSHADRTSEGSTPLKERTWHYVAVVREPERVTVYLDGKQDSSASVPQSAGGEEIILAGRGDIPAAASGGGEGPLEGKLDEVSMFDRALPADEIAKHYAAQMEEATSARQQ